MSTSFLEELTKVSTAPSALPPGPARRVRLWEIAQLRRSILDVVIHLRERYGDLALLRVGPFQIVFLSDPEFIRQVLVRDHAHFHKSYGIKRMRRILGKGLLTSEEPLHMRQRKLMQPAFHRDALKQYAEVMLACTAEADSRWHEQAEVDMDQEMMRLTLAIVGKTLFDADVERDAEDVGAALTTVLHFFPRLLVPFGEAFIRLPLPSHRRFLRARKQLDAVIYRLVEERRRSGGEGRDLLTMLLNAREEGSGMTDRQVRDEAMTLFLAGHETTAVALTWTWYLLATHPEATERLHQELDQVLEGRMPRYEDLPRLVITRQIIQESMRLYPPAFIFGRTVRSWYELGPYRLAPRRSMIFMSPYGVHRDPRFFEDPEAFKPERWTPEFEEQLPKFAYFPFGGGPRVCIGASFAWTEAVLALATLARRWKAELLPGQDMTPQPLITLRPGEGLRMRLHRR